MKKATVCIYSDKYKAMRKVQKDSLVKFLPGWHHEEVHTDSDPLMPTLRSVYKQSDPGAFSCAIRPAVVLEMFARGYDVVLFLGADVVFYHSAWDLGEQGLLYNAEVTPHVLRPLPEDGLHPSNSDLVHAGQINSDFVIWYNTSPTREFLRWQADMQIKHCADTPTMFYDQSWLNFLPFMVPNVNIIKHPGYNAAYYNLHERSITWTGEYWKAGPHAALVAYQFTGWKDANTVSMHQNRQKFTPDLKKLYDEYAAALMEASK